MERHDRATGRKVTILIDSGSTNNYIHINSTIGESVPLPKIIKTKTLHGISEIKSKRIINVLDNDLTFFDIKELNDYDMILGEQGLRQIKAKLDLFEYKIYYKKPIVSQKINYTNNSPKFETEINNLMQKNKNISEKLPFTTTIQATVRTKTEDPVWTKQYPYPYADKAFVDSEIEKLLENDIIEKSFSPYNSPVWTVPKKGFDEYGRPKRRLVIDFQKLNNETITDKYPIPDINMIIQNLGKSRYFSTIDLESGFHQISIKPEDREKTAFSVNFNKFQFKRMPFGLKNAPSIFQRCVNDILQPYIGDFAYVYIDDVIVFSKTEKEHLEHISLIFEALHQANMKASDEKSHFFKEKIEYLGHIIMHNKITVDPEKIATIRDYETPKTLKQLRSFLGLSGYYRKFIKDYAQITKPLTVHLRGENGLVTKNQSSKILINLDDAALNAFEKIKILLQEKIELYQPDFSKPFELTTDASNMALGAVLSQERNPITFISRTLNKTEQNYATNEKELLAVVWALQKLRNYLYGVSSLIIYTDHQSLIHSISDKNPNTKLKRWKNFIAQFGAEIRYKPGFQNVVADALSRHQSINVLTDETVHSTDSSPVENIERVPYVLNRYKNQFELVKTSLNSIESKTVFPDYTYHKINFIDKGFLISGMKNLVSKNHLNAIFASEEDFYFIKNPIFNAFPNEKFVFTTNVVENVTDLNKKLQIVDEIHTRAHRNSENNYHEGLKYYFWPKMKNDFKKKAKSCEICKTQKYERIPGKQPIGTTPIPMGVGESISMDIFHIDNKLYVSCVDRYSKYLFLHAITSKLNFQEHLEEIITQTYPHCKTLITDNEAIFCSHAARAIYDKYKITHITTPAQHSTSNGSVERTHSTLIELIRCLCKQNNTASSDEVFNAVKAYNDTIHSVIGQRPTDVNRNPNKYTDISKNIELNQKKILDYHNKNRKNRNFEPNEIIFVKSNRRRKDANAYTKHTVQKDLGDSVLTTKNKIYHKDSIRRNE